MQYYNKKTVGVRIRQLRKDKCLTQSSMSELLEYTNERQLQRIESGETSCSIEKLMEIAQILDTSTDFILFEFRRNNSDANFFDDILADLSEIQKLYLEMILRVAAENIDMVC